MVFQDFVDYADSVNLLCTNLIFSTNVPSTSKQTYLIVKISPASFLDEFGCKMNLRANVFKSQLNLIVVLPRCLDIKLDKQEFIAESSVGSIFRSGLSLNLTFVYCC